MTVSTTQSDKMASTDVPGSDRLEPFPTVAGQNSSTVPGTVQAELPSNTRSHARSNASTLAGRIRSLSKTFEEAEVRSGMWDATGTAAAAAPLLRDIRRGSYGSDGWEGKGQLQERERRASFGRRDSSKSTDQNPGSPIKNNSSGLAATIPENTVEPPVSKAHERDFGANPEQRSSSETDATPITATAKSAPGVRTTPFDNGYEFPPKHTWQETSMTLLKASWGFASTWFGFLIIVYGLNVVAWGAMIFFLLLNAAPAMCYPPGPDPCNDINSPRRIWVEITSQILTALFSLTAFGLAPIRFRDMYYLLKFRLFKQEIGLRRLAGIHRGWFRLPGSQDLPIKLGPAEVAATAHELPTMSIPYPPEKIPDAPLTGIRGSPTPLWKMDFVLWMYVGNTITQVPLSAIMWGMNRYNRPSFAVGMLVAIGSIVAAVGGIMVFIEGRKLKAIEGVAVSEADQERLKRDRELGITHYNNLSGKPPKEKKEKKSHFGKKQRTTPDNIQMENTTSSERMS